MFEPTSAILVFLAFFIVTTAVASLKKVYFFFRFKKRYYVFPRPSIQGIANIAMVIALSVAVLLLLTFVTSNAFSVLFRAFPGSRVTIEGILIKIGGLMFGPFIGTFIGALTDLLSILMTAGIFHYGYFISAMAYGLMAGLIRTIFSFWKQNKTWYATVATLISGLTFFFTSLFIFLIKQNEGGFTHSILPFNPEIIPSDLLITIFGGFTILLIIGIWILCLFSNKYRKWKNQITFRKNESIKPNKKPVKSYFNNMCLILMCALTTEVLINVLLMPSFDADLSTLGYDNWFLIRFTIFIPMIAFNFIIIYPVYVVISPIINWDYRKELSEDYKIPFYVN
ncbi:MAG: hypothetical protein K2H56_02625 [Malacoplasma sp.]|nr:hypothetical protein [Malacoplasma sp.]MDE7100200.1 hypothetical protein [Malacoplasma sp.]